MGIVAAALAGVALSAGLGTAAAAPKAKQLDKVTLQLKWVTDTQFGGYYAAQQLGYFKKFGLDVTLRPGGPSITPEQVVASGQAQVGIDWLPSLLAARDTGTGLVNIALMFARSGMTELTWKSSGITSVPQMRGKKVGVWCCGNQPELFAALAKNGIDPSNPKDVTIVNQPFDMNLFLQHQVDAAAAMTYNELAQVLETKDPKTGKLISLNDLNVFKMASPAVGTGMLEDNIFTTARWLKSPANRATAVRFLGASLAGWIYCRDHVQSCVNIVLKNGPTLGHGHQLWEMNEINKLIWPNTTGIGTVPASAIKQTETIAKKYGVIKKTPAAWETNYKLVAQALAGMKAQGLNVNGKSYKPLTVHVTAGGK